MDELKKKKPVVEHGVDHHNHDDTPEWVVEKKASDNHVHNTKYRSKFGGVLHELMNKVKDKNELTGFDLLQGTGLMMKANYSDVMADLQNNSRLIKAGIDHHKYNPKEEWKIEAQKEDDKNENTKNQAKYSGVLQELLANRQKLQEGLNGGTLGAKVVCEAAESNRRKSQLDVQDLLSISAYFIKNHYAKVLNELKDTVQIVHDSVDHHKHND